MTIEFATILRMGELLNLKIQDLHIVLRDDKEVSDYPGYPEYVGTKVKGVFFHVVWRKTAQDKDVWIPMTCRVSLSILLRQLYLLRKDGRDFG